MLGLGLPEQAMGCYPLGLVLKLHNRNPVLTKSLPIIVQSILWPIIVQSTAAGTCSWVWPHQPNYKRHYSVSRKLLCSPLIVLYHYIRQISIIIIRDWWGWTKTVRFYVGNEVLETWPYNCRECRWFPQYYGSVHTTSSYECNSLFMCLTFMKFIKSSQSWNKMIMWPKEFTEIYVFSHDHSGTHRNPTLLYLY